MTAPVRSAVLLAACLSLLASGSAAMTQNGWNAAAFSSGNRTVVTIAKDNVTLTTMDIPAGNLVSMYSSRIDENGRGRSVAHGTVELRVRGPFSPRSPADMADVMATSPIVLRLSGVDVTLETRPTP
jgi:hypothetical protein